MEKKDQEGLFKDLKKFTEEDADKFSNTPFHFKDGFLVDEFRYIGLIPKQEFPKEIADIYKKIYRINTSRLRILLSYLDMMDEDEADIYYCDDESPLIIETNSYKTIIAPFLKEDDDDDESEVVYYGY